MQKSTKITPTGKIIVEANTEILKSVSVNRTRVSDILPIMKMVAADYGLKLSRNKDFETVRRIVINCVKNN